MPHGKRAVPLTHPDKVFWPEEGYTKGDLIAYYEQIAPYILPHLAGRPCSLHRFPDGIRGVHFFQKNVRRETLPRFVETLLLRAKTTGKPVRYAMCNNEESLLYLANFGCIEFHPWNSRKGSLVKPDFIVFDLDPGPRSSFGDAVEVARVLHRILDAKGVANYVKTSGKRGLHVYAPTNRKISYAAARAFARAAAEEVVRRAPRIASVEHWPKDRKGKVFIDIARNAEGQTTAAPYSVRPVPGATVSTPLAWSEVTARLSPKRFTMQNMLARLKKKGDLWRAIMR